MADPIGDLLSSLGFNYSDFGSLAAAGIGGLLGYSNSGGGSSQSTGYQGGIPIYTASREYLPSPEDRVPGSAGRRYFSDVMFTPQEAAAAQPQTPVAPANNTNTGQSDYDRMLNNEGAAAGGYVRKFAGGGLSSLGMYSDGGQMLKGPGTGQSDDIPATIEGEQPARLARDEFVVPADVVSMLGDGSSDAGAERLYAMMDRIRKAAHGKTKQQKEINPNQVLPA